MSGNIKKILNKSNALLEGHFLLSNGLHSDRFFQCAKLLEHPEMAAEALAPVAEMLADLEFDVVLGPALGGIVVAYEIARQTGKRAIFSERDEKGNMVLRRNFSIKKGERVLIAEDVCSTFKSVSEVAQLAIDAGGTVVAIAVIVDRSSGLGPYPVYSAIRMALNIWDEEHCPLCKKGDVEIINLGNQKVCDVIETTVTLT